MLPEISSEVAPVAPTHLGKKWPGMKGMNGDEGDERQAMHFGIPALLLLVLCVKEPPIAYLVIWLRI